MYAVTAAGIDESSATELTLYALWMALWQHRLPLQQPQPMVSLRSMPVCLKTHIDLYQWNLCRNSKPCTVCRCQCNLQ
jgi:hypothetical protein